MGIPASAAGQARPASLDTQRPGIRPGRDDGNPMLATPCLTARLLGPRRPGPPPAQPPGSGDSGTPDGVTLTGRAAAAPPSPPRRDPGRDGRDPARPLAL